MRTHFPCNNKVEHFVVPSTLIRIIMQSTTGFHDIVNAGNTQLDLYPNPASNQVVVSFEGQPGIREGTLQLINIGGQILFSRNYQAGLPTEQMIPLDQIPDGLYTVILYTPGGHFTGKLSILKR